MTARERQLEIEVAALREALLAMRLVYREQEAEIRGMVERLDKYEHRAPASADGLGLGSSLASSVSTPRHAASVIGAGCYQRKQIRPDGVHG